MKYPYILIYESSSPTNDSEFIELVRSNYVSKKFYTNVFILAADGDDKNTPSAQDIYNKIRVKLPFEMSFIVAEFEDFYGWFTDDVIEWVKIQFPNLNWVD